MDVYVLDTLMRRIQIVDSYESFIWTDRKSSFGDFQMVIAYSPQMKTLLAQGTQIGIADSRHVMEVKNVSDDTDAEGRRMLTIVGRSLEWWLSDRGTRRPVSGAPASVPWVLNDTPGNIIRYMFNLTCVNNEFIPEDHLPLYSTGNLYPADTRTENTTILNYEVTMSNLYDIFKEISEAYDLGFRLYRGPDDSKLYFNVYAGSDRTTQQSTLPPVIFSPDLENLSNVSEFSSSMDYKNTAYVFSKNGSRRVFAPGYESATGFARRVMTVDASNIETAAGTALQNELEAAGQFALAQQKSVTAIDGELSQNSKYVYLRDYYLGDLVEMRTDEGNTSIMQVTEQIFVSDAQGVRAYPTLATNLFITPGSWLSWDSNQVWADAPGTWSTAS